MEKEPMMQDQDNSAPILWAAARILLYVTVIGIILYWSAVFSGVAPIEELVPGYTAWFMAFPLADSWIALAAVASLALDRFNPHLSAVFLAAAGSALIFLGLNALGYGYQTGLLFTLSAGEIVEIAIKVYCVSAGTLFLAASHYRFSSVNN